MASWSMQPSCSCGRSHRRLEDIHGRWRQDVLINQDHSFVSLTSLNMHSDVFDQIIRYQYYQDTVGEVVLKLVVTHPLSDHDTKKIMMQLHEKNTRKNRLHN